MQFNGTPEEWDALVKKNRQTIMKLYTEEQVKSLVHQCRIYNVPAERFLFNYTPISLPSDEEIDKKSFERLTLAQISGFRLGAKWMIDKILNK